MGSDWGVGEQSFIRSVALRGRPLRSTQVVISLVGDHRHAVARLPDRIKMPEPCRRHHDRDGRRNSSPPSGSPSAFKPRPSPGIASCWCRPPPRAFQCQFLKKWVSEAKRGYFGCHFLIFLNRSAGVRRPIPNRPGAPAPLMYWVTSSAMSWWCHKE